MRLALLVQVTATALLICGCPGGDQDSSSADTLPGISSSGQGGAGGQGGATQSASGTGGAGGGVSMECVLAKNELDVKLVEAKTCNPAIDIIQCVDTVTGVCCDEIVGLKDSPEVQAYLEALKKYQALSCNPEECKDVVCPTAPTGKCTPSGNGAGSCSTQP